MSKYNRVIIGILALVSIACTQENSTSVLAEKLRLYDTSMLEDSGLLRRFADSDLQESSEEFTQYIDIRVVQAPDSRETLTWSCEVLASFRANDDFVLYLLRDTSKVLRPERKLTQQLCLVFFNGKQCSYRMLKEDQNPLIVDEIRWLQPNSSTVELHVRQHSRKDTISRKLTVRDGKIENVQEVVAKRSD